MPRVALVAWDLEAPAAWGPEVRAEWDRVDRVAWDRVDLEVDDRQVRREQLNWTAASLESSILGTDSNPLEVHLVEREVLAAWDQAAWDLEE